MNAAAPSAFGKLAALLAEAAEPDSAPPDAAMGARLRQAVQDPAFIKEALLPDRPTLDRLATLAALHLAASALPGPARLRNDVMQDIDRLGMRLMSAERLVEGILAQPGSALKRAAALLQLVKGGALPAGACAKLVLEEARKQLSKRESLEELQRNGAMRDQILGLLTQSAAQSRARV